MIGLRINFQLYLHRNYYNEKYKLKNVIFPINIRPINLVQSDTSKNIINKIINDENIKNKTNKANKEKIKYINDYDDNTTNLYYNRRIKKLNTLSGDKIKKKYIFKFYYKWDPFNGIRLDKDEIGPLYFDALELYEFYFVNRFRELWIKESIDNIPPYYGEIVGSGISMKKKGNKTHKYLYRLPIIDCYLPNIKNNNISTKMYSYITFGPLLTKKEIEHIDKIVLLEKSDRTPLSRLKELYDGALDKNPDISKYKEIHSSLNNEELIYLYNTQCVNKLVGLKK